MVIVKLAKLGSASKEFTFENNVTLSTLLEAALESSENLQFTRNGMSIGINDTLRNGDTVYAAKSVKGNISEITFMRLGDSSVSIPVDGNISIKDAISRLASDERSKFYREDGSPVFEFRYNGAICSDTTVIVYDGNNVRIICSKKVKGNSDVVEMDLVNEAGDSYKIVFNINDLVGVSDSSQHIVDEADDNSDKFPILEISLKYGFDISHAFYFGSAIKIHSKEGVEMFTELHHFYKAIIKRLLDK